MAQAMEPNPEVWPGETEHRWKTIRKLRKTWENSWKTMENYGSFHVLLLFLFIVFVYVLFFLFSVSHPFPKSRTYGGCTSHLRF